MKANWCPGFAVSILSGVCVGLEVPRQGTQWRSLTSSASPARPTKRNPQARERNHVRLNPRPQSWPARGHSVTSLAARGRRTGSER